MTSLNDIRATFLGYFERNGHEVVDSSPLVPRNDPTLMFTNSGMVQFKNLFTGLEKRDYVRATTSQKCVRAGGKHNDLDNVGYTARHHTFFEMLGNFSFGDYFKDEAIPYAWNLLTGDFGIDKSRLLTTVYHTDDEAAAIWKKVGVPEDRIIRIATSDNFWQMGPTGPCGPCTEIFYDHGDHIWGGPPGSAEEDGDRFIEIWNIVFMQNEQFEDGSMRALDMQSIDTGMGLERLAAVLQGVHSNYQIDLFRKLIAAAAELAGCDDLADNSLKVIADHIRACAFLVVDGVLPSNEGRGYVLRRIIRRAIRHGHKLGLKEPFFHKLVPALSAEMGGAFPELPAAQEQVMRVLRVEEERFAETLDQGMRILDERIAGLDSGAEIPGETLFLLYDTYGFPVDLTADIARERGLSIDQAGFDRAMEAQRERARAASRFAVDYASLPELDVATEFTGYDGLTGEAHVVALLRDGARVETLAAGDEGVVVLDRSPFYAESGGQVGDHGELRTAGGMFVVDDTQKHGAAHLHTGHLAEGALAVGDRVVASVDPGARQATALNHSATHLLHAALRQVLGDHVTQKGSLVEPGRLRFDFAHFEPVTPAQLDTIERLVNTQVRANADVETAVMGYDEAVGAGAMALFGEKYGDKVRVLRIGEFSTELCGGTHVRRAGDIGLFKIVSEAGIAAGVRRIEAVTGEGALARIAEDEACLGSVAELVKADRETVAQKVGALLERTRGLEKELDRLKQKLASSAGSDLAAQAVQVDGLNVLAARLDGTDPKSLRGTVDQLKQKLGSAAIVLAAVNDDRISLVAGVTDDSTDRIKAGELVNAVASPIGGKGGGRADMAQGGGSDVAALDGALAAVTDWVRARLG